MLPLLVWCSYHNGPAAAMPVIMLAGPHLGVTSREVFLIQLALPLAEPAVQHMFVLGRHLREQAGGLSFTMLRSCLEARLQKWS